MNIRPHLLAGCKYTVFKTLWTFLLLLDLFFDTVLTWKLDLTKFCRTQGLLISLSGHKDIHWGNIVQGYDLKYREDP